MPIPTLPTDVIEVKAMPYQNNQVYVPDNKDIKTTHPWIVPQLSVNQQPQPKGHTDAY
jgi:hypothetical protein